MTVEAATLLTTVTAAIPAAHPPMPSRTLSRRSARSPLTIVPPPQGSIRAFIAQTHLFTGARQRPRADAADHSSDRRIDNVTADRMKTEAAATVDDGETNGNSDGGDNDDEDQVNGDEETPRDNDDEMSDGGYRAMSGDIALSPTTQNIHNILMIAKQQQMEQSMQRAQGHYRHEASHVEALELETTSDMEHNNGDDNDDATENGSGGASSDEEDSDNDRRTTHRARKKDDGTTSRRRRRPTKRAEPARTRERDHSHGKDKRRTARAKSSTSDRRTHARGRAADNNSGDEEEAHDDGDEAPTYTPQNKRRKNKRQQHASSADAPQQATVAHDVQQIPSFLKHHVIHDAAANALASAVAASAFSNALPQHSRPDMQNLLDGGEIGSQRKKRQRKPRDAATDLLTTVAALVPPLDTTISDTALHAAKTLSAAAAALPSASLASRREAVSPIGVPKKRRLSSKVHTYSCPICAKSFNDASSLRKHLKIHGDRQFQCDECDKRFIDNSKLKRHQLVHSGERKFICPYPGCNKKFALDFNLKSHSRVHTGEKPFPCAHPNCGRRFAQVSNLKAHYKTHSAAATTTTHAATGGGGRSTTPNALGDTATVDTAVVINGALYPPFFPTAIPTAGAYLNATNVSVIAATPRAQAANTNNNHNFGFELQTTTTSSHHA